MLGALICNNTTMIINFTCQILISKETNNLKRLQLDQKHDLKKNILISAKKNNMNFIIYNIGLMLLNTRKPRNPL